MKVASIFFFLVVNTSILFIPSFTYRRNEITADLKLRNYVYPKISERRLQDEQKTEEKKEEAKKEEAKKQEGKKEEVPKQAVCKSIGFFTGEDT